MAIPLTWWIMGMSKCVIWALRGFHTSCILGLLLSFNTSQFQVNRTDSRNGWQPSFQPPVLKEKSPARYKTKASESPSIYITTQPKANKVNSILCCLCRQRFFFSSLGCLPALGAGAGLFGLSASHCGHGFSPRPATFEKLFLLCKFPTYDSRSSTVSIVLI